MPAFLNSSLKASKEPKASSIAAPRSPLGLAAAVGAQHLPEERVVVVAAGVVADRALLVAGQAGEVLQHLLDVAVGPLGALEGGVGFVDVGLVVLVVVDAHRRLVDVGLERVVGVGKIGNGERHLVTPRSISKLSTEPSDADPRGRRGFAAGRRRPCRTLRRFLRPAGPKSARGTVSGSPPVQALKRYQAGFASRFSVSRPAERQNWQVPPSSVQVNHQTPPMRQRSAVGGEHREGLRELVAPGRRGRAPSGSGRCASPSPARSRRAASRASSWTRMIRRRLSSWAPIAWASAT